MNKRILAGWLMGVMACGMLLGLPLAGVVLNGGAIQTYMEFPPIARYVVHAPFSWWAFAGLGGGIVVVLVPFLRRVIRGEWFRCQAPARHGFPWWGWLGLAAGMTGWLLAWTRFPWFAPLQSFTFSPLWFAYIVVVNALTFRRTGGCMMLDRTRVFAGLFLASAFFWWFFEYLNRFVQNWYYEGIGDLAPWQYFIFATLPFSTVLPAVMGTYELLKTYPDLSAGLDDFMPLRIRHPRRWAAVTVVISALGLAGIGIRPDVLFPLLWLAPLLILTSIQTLAGQDTVLSGMERGGWRRVWLLALSALICGFFWEMWNYHSLAKWIYAVPYVNRFHIFEMPILGYAGYLPFGLECAAIAGLVEMWLRKEKDF